ncbi:MAG: 3-isopropylmalate dehydratase small subunit [Saprospiraceae bacterium]|nr:3-isopropylmalate dehydratase small subunit [Pyrinomonadaceae bacterium]
MNKFTLHTGRTVLIDAANVDTDQIIPKQFLKRIERTGYGEFLFNDWRFAADGSTKADFILNDPKFSGASILITGANFGCGSSREHAAWSLLDYGFRVVIASSFAEIFYNNSLNNGLLPVVLGESDIRILTEITMAGSHYFLSVDLTEQKVSDGRSFSAYFNIDPFRRYCLLNGLDDIALTLEHEAKISDFENRAVNIGTLGTPVI